jgi:hypothetical protein
MMVCLFIAQLVGRTISPDTKRPALARRQETGPIASRVSGTVTRAAKQHRTVLSAYRRRKVDLGDLANRVLDEQLDHPNTPGSKKMLRTHALFERKLSIRNKIVSPLMNGCSSVTSAAATFTPNCLAFFFQTGESRSISVSLL